MRNSKKKSIFLITFIIMLLIAGCSKSPGVSESNNKGTDDYKSQYMGKKPVVSIQMEDGAVIKAELYPDIAPKTVDNFVGLVQKGFYDGLIFHRVIPEFIIQGGDPTGTGTGGPGYAIPGEFKNNGFNNDLRHSRGVLSMARSQDPNSAGSQFFIMVKDSPHLDGEYAAFGKVIEGMDEVDKIVNIKRDKNDKHLTDQRIKKVTVEIK